MTGDPSPIVSKLDANDLAHSTIIGLKRGIIDLSRGHERLPPRARWRGLERVTTWTRPGLSIGARNDETKGARVWVAAPLFDVRGQLAGRRIAAPAPGHRVVPPRRCRPETMERAAATRHSHLRLPGGIGASSHGRALDARGRNHRGLDQALPDPDRDPGAVGWPPGRKHGGRARDVGTRSLVGRRSSLRMEAHRSTTAPKSFKRALSFARSAPCRSDHSGRSPNVSGPYPEESAAPARRSPGRDRLSAPRGPIGGSPDNMRSPTMRGVA